MRRQETSTGSVASDRPCGTGKIGRNDPCPCGSGRKFKQCCAAAQPPSTKQLVDAALTRFRQGDLDASEGLVRRVLGDDRDNPEALFLLGAIRHRQGSLDQATLLLGHANQLSGWRLPGYLNLFGVVLGEQLSGWESGRAARLRDEYRAWLTEPRPLSPEPPPVSIVLVARDHAATVEACLDSIFAQTYRALELVVIDDGSVDDSAEKIRAKLGQSPFASRFIVREARGLAASLNEGIALTHGRYINPMTPDGLMTPDRVATLVDAIAAPGFEWGFGALAQVDLPEAEASALRRISERARELDTIGTGFLTRDVAGFLGNLFFSRALFDALSGFQPYRQAAGRDFGLRALWLAEPIAVATTGYLQQAMPPDRQDDAEAAREQALALKAYHELALSQGAPNRFAPTLASRGPRYFKLPLAAQQAVLFEPRALVDLAARIVAKRRPGRYPPGALDNKGLNVLGYLRAESGLGECVRGLVRACQAGGIPVTPRDADVDIPPRQADPAMDPCSMDRMTARKTVLYLNPDMLKQVRERHGAAEFENQYLIGAWFWELEQLPDDWRYAFELVDEIWVATEFVRAAVARATDKPVVTIPFPIEASPGRAYARADFGLAEDRFLFLFSFDFSSYSQRKNPDAALHAFELAFADGRDEVGLVIKCSGGHQHPDELAALLRRIGADPRIQVIDRILSIDAVHGLQSVCDAYISLHRAEGLGLGLAEAMALGKPAIATAYSGNLEFMNADNSCLVDYTLIPVRPGEFAYWQDGWQWAEADVDQAATMMRRLLADVEFRHRIGRRAALDMADRFSPAATAKAVAARLAAIEAGQAADV